MKIASFKEESMEGIKVFKPIQYILIKTKGNGKAKMRVRLINSENGRTEELIPMLDLYVLGDIATKNEGYYLLGGDGRAEIMIMLHPDASVGLNNNKYLEIDVKDLDGTISTEIFGIENREIDDTFFCKYNKFYMAEGELQKKFVVGENEELIVPIDNENRFSEIQMNCFNGSTPNYLIHEVKALSRLQNDITCVTQDTLAITTTAQKAQIVQFGYYKMGTLNLDGVRDFEIKRDTATTSLEFIMLDRVKTTVVG